MAFDFSNDQLRSLISVLVIFGRQFALSVKSFKDLNIKDAKAFFSIKNEERTSFRNGKREFKSHMKPICD